MRIASRLARPAPGCRRSGLTEAMCAGLAPVWGRAVQAHHLDDLVADRVQRARTNSSAPERSSRRTPPRMARIAAPVRSRARRGRSAPRPRAVRENLGRSSPPSAASGAGSSCAVIVLPQPNSPTRPKVSPSPIEKVDAVRRREQARLELERHAQVLHLDQGRRRQPVEGTVGHRSALPIGIDGVAQAVAEEVEGDDDEHDEGRQGQRSQGDSVTVWMFCASKAEVQALPRPAGRSRKGHPQALQPRTQGAPCGPAGRRITADPVR